MTGYPNVLSQLTLVYCRTDRHRLLNNLLNSDDGGDNSEIQMKQARLPAKRFIIMFMQHKSGSDEEVDMQHQQSADVPATITKCKKHHYLI